MFDSSAKKTYDLKNLHLSLQNSGCFNIKIPKKSIKLQPKGYMEENLSDDSYLINPSRDPIMIGIESFDLDYAPQSKKKHTCLMPLTERKNFSLIWLFIPSEFPQMIQHKCFGLINMALNMVGMLPAQPV